MISLNRTEIDSISIDGNSSRNNARIKVESIPELKATPTFFELESMF